jgi:type IV pilus assembly protein PilM
MTSTATTRLRLACEILSDRVVAGRAADRRDYVEVYTARPLPGGAVIPSLASANVADAAVLRQAVAEALAVVSGHSRDLIAVIPDAATRVFLLDFDTMPERPSEASAVVRFRLRKSLPFDVERAQVSFQARRSNGGVKVVAAVASLAVIEEYEALFRDSGYSPGVVVPSMLAALGPLEAGRPTLVAKVDTGSITVAIVEQGGLRLLRTLENPHGTAVDGRQLADQVHPSLVFFQDTYGAPIERILLAGTPLLDQVARELEGQVGIKVEPLLTSRYLGTSLSGDLEPKSALAGVVGALVG